MSSMDSGSNSAAEDLHRPVTSELPLSVPEGSSSSYYAVDTATDEVLPEEGSQKYTTPENTSESMRDDTGKLLTDAKSTLSSCDKNDTPQVVDSLAVDGVQVSACADIVSEVTLADSCDQQCADTQELCSSLSNDCEVATAIADRCDTVKADTTSLSLADSLADGVTNDHSEYSMLHQVVDSGSVVCTANQTDGDCKTDDEFGVCAQCPAYSAADVHSPADKEAAIDYSAVNKATAVESIVNHSQPNTVDTQPDGLPDERQNENPSAKHCADTIMSLPSDSSAGTVGLEIDCTSAANISEISAENKDEAKLCVSSVSVTQPHIETVDDLVGSKSSGTEVFYGSDEYSSTTNDDESPLCLSVSAASKLSVPTPACDVMSLMEDSKRGASSEGDIVLSSDELVASSAVAAVEAVAEGHSAHSVAIEHSNSKCLSLIINSSLAQANQFNTDSQLHSADADSLKASDTATISAETNNKSNDADTCVDNDNQSSLCSKPRYVSNVDVSMPSSLSFCTQPLKSLADLVQKVSVSSSGGSEQLEHISKRHLLTSCDAETILDATAAMRNSPLYSARVSYMSASSPCRSRRAAASTITAASQQTLEQNSAGHGSSEFKKPSSCVLHHTTIGPRRSAQVDHNGECASVPAMTNFCHQPSTSSSADVDSTKTASEKHDSQSSPATKNSVDGEMLAEGGVRLTNDLSSKPGRRDRKKSPSAGRCKNRVKSCKADVVHGKLLKDLIVACSGDGVASSSQILPDGESVKTSTVGAAESLEQNKSTPALVDQASNPSEIVKSSKLSLSARRQRKGAVLERKSTKLLSNNITLIDVAAMKSCVEKDYSELIRSIQQSPNNKTALNESKGKKKKENKKTENCNNLELAGEEIQDKGCSSKSRCNRKTVDKLSDGCAEPNVKSTRSKSKKQLPQKTVNSSIADRGHESSTADSVKSVHDESVACPTATTNDKSHDFTVLNSLLPTSKKSKLRKKKKSSPQKEESEVDEVKNGTETRSHCKAAASKTQTVKQEAVEQNKSIEEELAENSASVLNTNAIDDSTRAMQVTYANRKKRRKLLKKKSPALLDSGGDGVDRCQDVDCSTSSSVVVSGKSRKRKSQVLSSLSASDTSYEPAVKNSKSVALVDNSSLDAEESIGTSDTVSQIQSSKQSPSSSEVKPAQRKDQQQLKNNNKKKKVKTKMTCAEVMNGTSTIVLHKKILKEDFQNKMPSSQTVTDADVEAGLDLTAASLPLDGQTTTGGKGEEETGTVADAGKQNDSEPTQLPESAAFDDSTAVNVASFCLTEGKDGDVTDDEQKLFACTYCDYRARKKGQLRKHLSVHKVFSCAHCDFSADTQAGLDDHMSVKHPSRCGRRLCKRCHMLFRAGKVFTDHVEQCTGVKLSWQCPVCEKDFKFISAMKTHIHRYHGGSEVSASGDTELTANADDDAEDKLQLSGATDAVETNFQVSSASVSVQSPVTLPADGQLSAPIMLSASNAIPIPTAIPVLTPRPVPALVQLPTIIPVPASVSAVEPVGMVTAGNSVSSVRAVESSRTFAATASNSSALQSDSVLLNYSTVLPGVAADVGGTSSHDMMLNSALQSGTPAGHKLLDPPSDLQTAQADEHLATKLASSSSSLSASTVTVDGELRYPCELCPKSFKAKRSMVHHRRMIHEGGRLRKREAAAAAANDAAAAAVGYADDGEKIKTCDEDGTAAADRTEPEESDGIDNEAIVSSQHAVVEMGAETDAHSAADAAADAGPVRQVYTCSFAGCSHKFKRPGQLHRHEEKHAGPGTF